MKTLLLRLITMLSVLTLILNIINPFLTGYYWHEILYARSEPNYVLPKGCKLLYNSSTREYAAIVPNQEYGLLTDLKLKKYYFGIQDLRSSPTGDFYTSNDSSKVKYYVHKYMDVDNRLHNFKVIR